MARPPATEDAQMRHTFKVEPGWAPARDMAQLEVAGVLDERGEFRRQPEARAAISFNRRARPVFWTNPKVYAAQDAYSTERLNRDGYDLRHIREVLGLATLSAAKALCEGDPVDLGRVVAGVI